MVGGGDAARSGIGDLSQVARLASHLRRWPDRPIDRRTGPGNDWVIDPRAAFRETSG